MCWKSAALGRKVTRSAGFPQAAPWHPFCYEHAVTQRREPALSLRSLDRARRLRRLAGLILTVGLALSAHAYDGATGASPPRSYAVKARSYGTHPETDPPRYVRNLGGTGIAAFDGLDWLDAGMDFRERMEYRRDDLRRPFLATDENFLHRTRVFLGVRELLDPLRFAVEYQDSRASNSEFARDTRDFNEHELIQGYVELNFVGALGADPRGNQRPLRLRAGRMSWESLDRRLLGNNQWRNTTNNHEGFRLNLGQEANDWEVDLWGVQPILRDIERFDARNHDVWFYGGIVNWRRWSEFVTVQPYYMGLRQRERGTLVRREVHSPGLRAFGVLPGTAADFDLGLLHQFGHEGARRKSAWAYLLEFGYTVPHPWKPRFSAFYAFASGDRDPDDGVDQRFERFFGFARPWSADDNIVFENVKVPKLKVEFEPRRGLAFDVGYAWYWLASKRDRFNNLLNGINGDSRFNRDRSGASGDFLGHAVDGRVRWKANTHVDATLGYSHWTNGRFVRLRQQAALGDVAGSSDFLYLELSFSALPLL